MIAYIVEALTVLFANRVRTGLTALGLIIGVMAVIAIQTMGAGLAGATNGIFGSIGDRSFFVIPNVRQGDFATAQIKIEDLLAIKNSIPGVAEAMSGNNSIRFGHIGHNRARLAIGSEAGDPFNTSEIAQGRRITQADVDSNASVGILTEAARKKLFGDLDSAIGKQLRLGERRYTIIGVFAAPKAAVNLNFGGGDFVVPYTTYDAAYVQHGSIGAARFLLKPGYDPQTTEDAIVKALKKLKKKKADYITLDKRTLTRAVDGFFAGITLIVSLIGTVSLVVAGIGILNIMLVSVAERTREIGLRKAIGATKLQILAQFFIEALLLSLIGCAIGLVLGLSIGYGVNAGYLVRLSGVIAPIPWLQASLVATGFATVVTLLFGTYPAWRAAQLDPIEALRYE